MKELGAPINEPDNQGVTPLQLLAKEGSREMVETVIKSNVDLNQLDKVSKPNHFLHYLILIQDLEWNDTTSSCLFFWKC